MSFIRNIRIFLAKKEFVRIKENYKKILKQEFLEELDYELISKAYTKYVCNIKNECPSAINFANEDCPDVSIIIPVYNQFNLTMQCLESIRLNTKNLKYEIILIDDCSTDETKNLNYHVKNIRIIRNEQNLGFLKNCNKAIKYAKGKYIYLLNNDTYVLPNSIEALVETFKDDTKVGAVGSKLIRPNGKLQEAGSLVNEYGATVAIGNLDNPLSPQYDIEKEVDYCSGASLMTLKSLWDNLGGFDEQFSPGYYEETDYCKRLKTLGYKIIYQPKSEIIHFIGQSFNEKASKLMEINHQKFYDKWSNK